MSVRVIFFLLFFLDLEEKPLEQEIEGLEQDNQSELDDYGSGDFLKRRNTHLSKDQAKE